MSVNCALWQQSPINPEVVMVPRRGCQVNREKTGPGEMMLLSEPWFHCCQPQQGLWKQSRQQWTVLGSWRLSTVLLCDLKSHWISNSESFPSCCVSNLHLWFIAGFNPSPPIHSSVPAMATTCHSDGSTQPHPLQDRLEMGAKCILIWILWGWHVGLTRHTVGFSLVQSLGDDSNLPRKALSVLPRRTKLCQSPREGLIRCLWICEKEYSPLNKHVLLKNSL